MTFLLKSFLVFSLALNSLVSVFAEVELGVSENGTITNSTEEAAQVRAEEEASKNVDQWQALKDAAAGASPNPTEDGASEEKKDGGGNNTDWGGGTTVTVTEAIPWITDPKSCTWDINNRKCKATIKPGFGSVMDILSGLIKYTTFIVALIAILMLVVSGIQYSISGADKWAADEAKKRIQKVLSGIFLLFLIGFILNSVAPWIYK